MDKRVFALTGTSDLVWNIAGSALILVIGVIGTLLLWDSWHITRYAWTVEVVMALLFQWYVYVSRRATKLEVSDEGLFVMSRRRLGYMLRWDTITSCIVSEAPRKADMPFGRVVLTDSRRRIIIPGSCPDGAEILEILKQRLPENVFHDLQKA